MVSPSTSPPPQKHCIRNRHIDCVPTPPHPPRIRYTLNTITAILIMLEKGYRYIAMDLTSAHDIDRMISENLQLPAQRTRLRQAAALFAHSADSWFWLAGLIILYVVGPRPWRPLLITLSAGIIVTAAFVLSLKRAIKRPRPAGEWGKIYRSTDPHSFPSGHAARCALVTLLIFLSGPWWLGIGMVAWTLGVDYARIALGVHYLSDILAGTGIGLLFGWGVYWITA